MGYIACLKIGVRRFNTFGRYPWIIEFNMDWNYKGRTGQGTGIKSRSSTYIMAHIKNSFKKCLFYNPESKTSLL